MGGCGCSPFRWRSSRSRPSSRRSRRSRRRCRSEVEGPAPGTPGCPVTLTGLRLLTVSLPRLRRPLAHWGSLVVNAAGRRHSSSTSLRAAVRDRLPDPPHAVRRHVRGTEEPHPPDGDFTGVVRVPRGPTASPCTGASTNKTTGSWSEHAYGEAIDLNPARRPVRRVRHDAATRRERSPTSTARIPPGGAW